MTSTIPTRPNVDEPACGVDAALFRRCRAALGLSAAGMAAALRVSGGRTVRRWEAGDRPVPGLVWVALQYMLGEAGEERLAAELNGLQLRPAPRAKGDLVKR